DPAPGSVLGNGAGVPRQAGGPGEDRDLGWNGPGHAVESPRRGRLQVAADQRRGYEAVAGAAVGASGRAGLDAGPPAAPGTSDGGALRCGMVTQALRGGASSR